MTQKRTLCIDFDGVIHSYVSGWKGAAIIPDPPVKGALRWLMDLLDCQGSEGDLFEVCIYSSRSKEPGAIDAIRFWLSNHGLSDLYLELIRFPTQKPAAFLTIDDRAMRFEGIFPSPEQILSFKPWKVTDTPPEDLTPLCFIDLETTGLDTKQHEIIELGAIRVNPSTWEVIQELETKVRPEHIETASQKALDMNGYSVEAWAEASYPRWALSELIPLLQSSIPAGHNPRFDMGFLEAAWKKYGQKPPKIDYHLLDTVSLAMPLYLKGKVKSLKLGEVYHYLFGKDYPDPHRALSDCRASMEVAKALMGGI